VLIEHSDVLDVELFSDRISESAALKNAVDCQSDQKVYCRVRENAHCDDGDSSILPEGSIPRQNSFFWMAVLPDPTADLTLRVRVHHAERDGYDGNSGGFASFPAAAGA
jgi:hypothetical protein